MIYIYLDERGNLGFDLKKVKPSNYFVIACIRIDDEETNKRLNRIIKRVRLRHLKKQYKEKPELKFSNTSPDIRKQVLKSVANENIKVYCLIANKKNIKKHLQEDKTLLYSLLIKTLFEDTFKQLKKDKLVIFMDRMLSQSNQEIFKTYILTQHEDLLYKIPKIDITHDNSMLNQGLQVADFIVGAIALKYETNNLEYYEIIKRVIENEKQM